MRSISILATGSELLDGRVVDTNSNFVARELAERGLKLRRVLVVDDDLTELVSGLRELAAVSDFIITSGGLGPTADDLTRDAVSSYFGVGLHEHPDGRKHLEEFFAKRGRPLDATNLRQALLPDGASMIPNANGSAPGFALSKADGPTVASLSGVPREFKEMFISTVLPMIESALGGVVRIQRETCKTFGLPESTVGRLIESLNLPADISVSYRASFPEVHVVLKAAEGLSLSPHVEAVRSVLGDDAIFSRDADDSFASALQRILLSRHETVATVESCTGGMIGEMLTRTPGSSATYQGGVVAYSNTVKEEIVGVHASTLAASGAVSAETVRELAQRAREIFHTTYGIGVSGIAGPEGGSAEKPVGTFFVGVSSPHLAVELRCLYPGERHRVRTYASYVALDLVRRMALGLPMPHGYPLPR